jgi:hypothetical protein
MKVYALVIEEQYELDSNFEIVGIYDLKEKAINELKKRSDKIIEEFCDNVSCDVDELETYEVTEDSLQLDNGEGSFVDLYISEYEVQ